MFGIPVEFILFALTLLGVALLHNQTFYVALTGVLAVALYKITFTGFKTGPGIGGFVGHLGHEWVTLANLLCLLLGFAILARHFEKSRIPEILPKYLPNDWKGAFLLLAMVWFISSFLDNIAAALIGGAMAHKLFKAKVHIGYLAGILILIFAMATNIIVNTHYTAISDSFPFIGVAVWLAILVTIPVRRHDWEVIGESLKGTFFLLFLVTSASMMPVEALPAASWHTAFGLGFVSAVFDNIPLTALAIKQDGYDWGFLAFGVGYGGSMLWFGSSAGVALSNMYPEAKNVVQWLRHGWHVAVAYVVSFLVMVAVLGWHPEPLNKGAAVPVAVEHTVPPAPTSVPAVQK
jgi:Na+/H+ antiporter NhaD/arsenite permease-like protein